jgi:hypothetical protein
MSNSLKKFQAWRLRRRIIRERRSLEWWEQTRAQGKARFVISNSLAYGLTMAGVFDVIDNIFYDGTKYSLLLNAIGYPIMGMVLGAFTWWDMESKYKSALIDARVKASPSGALPPHSNASQITGDTASN